MARFQEGKKDYSLSMLRGFKALYNTLGQDKFKNVEDYDYLKENNNLDVPVYLPKDENNFVKVNNLANCKVGDELWSTVYNCYAWKVSSFGNHVIILTPIGPKQRFDGARRVGTTSFLYDGRMDCSNSTPDVWKSEPSLFRFIKMMYQL